MGGDRCLGRGPNGPSALAHLRAFPGAAGPRLQPGRGGGLVVQRRSQPGRRGGGLRRLGRRPCQGRLTTTMSRGCSAWTCSVLSAGITDGPCAASALTCTARSSAGSSADHCGSASACNCADPRAANCVVVSAFRSPCDSSANRRGKSDATWAVLSATPCAGPRAPSCWVFLCCAQSCELTAAQARQGLRRHADQLRVAQRGHLRGSLCRQLLAGKLAELLAAQGVDLLGRQRPYGRCAQAARAPMAANCAGVIALRSTVSRLRNCAVPSAATCAGLSWASWSLPRAASGSVGPP